MKTDEELQRDVQDAMKWQPMLNAAEIGVSAKNGIITLSGIVDNYGKKIEAEDAAKSVAGVKAVVENIAVNIGGSWARKNDNEIAAAVVIALKWNWQVPDDKITIKVENGMVTLQGELHWYYQKKAATDAVKNLLGVTGVLNEIDIFSTTDDKIEKSAIENALKRNSAIDDINIRVEVSSGQVTLSGRVDSIYQKAEAEREAWNAPGVRNVINYLSINFEHVLR